MKLLNKYTFLSLSFVLLLSSNINSTSYFINSDNYNNIYPTPMITPAQNPIYVLGYEPSAPPMENVNSNFSNNIYKYLSGTKSKVMYLARLAKQNPTIAAAISVASTGIALRIKYNYDLEKEKQEENQLKDIVQRSGWFKNSFNKVAMLSKATLKTSFEITDLSTRIALTVLIEKDIKNLKAQREEIANSYIYRYRDIENKKKLIDNIDLQLIKLNNKKIEILLNK